MILDEYALIPDIFDPAAYSRSDYADMCLAHLKEPLLREALVRDLCDGGWSRHCLANAGTLHRLTKELVRKLTTSNRLCRSPVAKYAAPAHSTEWCQEALSSGNSLPLSGIVAANATKQHFTELEVVSIEKLSGVSWWQNRSPSETVNRKTAEYLRLLAPVLRQANSLMFIDPNINPSQQNYREFFQLLQPLVNRNPSPRVELHRSFCLGDGARRTFPTLTEWQQIFGPLDVQLRSVNLSAEVFLWQDFHDRHLITDIVGVTVGAGFDVTQAVDDETTWARLGLLGRENFQRRFDQATRPGDLKLKFKIGK